MMYGYKSGIRMIHDDTDDEYIYGDDDDDFSITYYHLSLLLYWLSIIIIVINYGDNKDYDGGDGDDYYILDTSRIDQIRAS